MENNRHLLVARLRLKTVWVSLCLLMLVIPLATQADDYTYTTNKGAITITGYTGTGGAVTVPDAINDLPVISFGSVFQGKTNITSVLIGTNVTSIQGYAFYRCASLANVTIPAGIKNIGSWTFALCNNLTSVIIPNGVTNIGERAFWSCTGLTNAVIPNSVTRIMNRAFYYCSNLSGTVIGDRVTSIESSAFEDCRKLTSIAVPNSVTNLGASAFYYCTGLTNVTIGTKVPGIEDGTFYNCSNLTSVTLGSSVTRIGNYAFEGCSKLNNVAIPADVASIGSGAFRSCNGLTGVTIPNSTTYLGDSVFYGCSSMTGVTIGSSVTNIGDYTFYGCDGLTGVTVPNSVTGIGNHALSYCRNLQSVMIGSGLTTLAGQVFSDSSSLSAITVDANNAVFSSSDGILFNKSQTLLYRCPEGKAGVCTIPSSVTSIRGVAFYSCDKLTKIYFHGNAPGTGWSVFDGAGNATIYYLAGATGWGATLAGHSTELLAYTYTTDNGKITITGYTGAGGDIIIPDAITGLPVTDFGNVFQGRTNITSVTIGTNITSIGSQAFQSCNALTRIFFKGNAPNLGSLAFDDGTGTGTCIPATIYYSFGTIGWTDPFGGLPIHDILAADFNYINTGTNVTITGYIGTNTVAVVPDTIEGLPVVDFGIAFQGRTNLAGVTIGTNIATISDGAFSNCTSLSSITIPSSVASIGNKAFYCCTNLTTATLPDNITCIGDGLFYGCSSLNSITIPAHITSIGAYAFASCSSLLRITVPGSVTSIGSNAFYYCTNLISVVLPDNITRIEDGLLWGCTSLTDVTIPDGVTSIGAHAFDSCSSLFRITIPGNVTSIGDGAFASCLNLTGAYFQGDAPVGISPSVFENIGNATVYYFPKTWGWGITLADRPTQLWMPNVQSGSATYDRMNGFGFNINWASGMVVIVEACTNLTGSVWVPVATNTMTGSSTLFKDQQCTNYPGRFYRLRIP